MYFIPYFTQHHDVYRVRDSFTAIDLLFENLETRPYLLPLTHQIWSLHRFWAKEIMAQSYNFFFAVSKNNPFKLLFGCILFPLVCLTNLTINLLSFITINLASLVTAITACIGGLLFASWQLSKDSIQRYRANHIFDELDQDPIKVQPFVNKLDQAMRGYQPRTNHSHFFRKKYFSENAPKDRLRIFSAFINHPQITGNANKGITSTLFTARRRFDEDNTIELNTKEKLIQRNECLSRKFG